VILPQWACATSVQDGQDIQTAGDRNQMVEWSKIKRWQSVEQISAAGVWVKIVWQVTHDSRTPRIGRTSVLSI
jgi:hypothetical protein